MLLIWGVERIVDTFNTLMMLLTWRIWRYYLTDVTDMGSWMYCRYVYYLTDVNDMEHMERWIYYVELNVTDMVHMDSWMLLKWNIWRVESTMEIGIKNGRFPTELMFLIWIIEYIVVPKNFWYGSLNLFWMCSHKNSLWEVVWEDFIVDTNKPNNGCRQTCP